MAKFKGTVRFQRADGFYNVYIRITHKRKVAYLKTDKAVSPKGIDKNNNIIDPFVLKYCVVKINIYTELLNKIDSDNWELPQIIEYLENGSSDVSFTNYAEKHIAELINRGQLRSAKNYELAVRSLKIYAGSNNVMFSHLTSYFINGWINTLSHTARAKEMYPVCVRQIFKAAQQDYNDYDLGIIRITTNPWVKVQIPNSDTPEKKAITMEDCRNFFFCKLPETDRINPLPEIARDITMMVLCLAGINTIDLYQLKKTDYIDGIICYQRAKTRKAREDNAYIEMRVPSILEPLFEKYRNKKDTEYLFNFHERYSSSDSFNADINRGIKDICIKSLGMVKGKDKLYSPYTFRHTWALFLHRITDFFFPLNQNSPFLEHDNPGIETQGR